MRLLLSYFSSEKFQLAYVEQQQHLPAIMTSKPSKNVLTKAASDIVNASPGGIQFFDRDANIDFSGQTLTMFLNFIKHLNVDKTMHELENLRLKVFEKQSE